MTRGRLAPSPTGEMHLGNARTALLAWLSARSKGGAVVMRIEDLDAARVVSGSEARICEDLIRLGLSWDEGPYRQSERAAQYTQAMEHLDRAGFVYPCACTRAEIARAASAPHGDEDTGIYPQTCRGLARDEVFARARQHGRVPCWRFRAGNRAETYTDGIVGNTTGQIDDFVVRRADGVAAYQLAVVVDDASMQISEVVRGDDLLSSTLRQLALYEALGLQPPHFAHVPLVLAPGGTRMAKRTRPESVRDLLKRGFEPGRIVGMLAASAGLCEVGKSLAPDDLLSGFRLEGINRNPVTLSADTIGPL